MIKLSKVQTQIMAACRDDYEGLWAILEYLREEDPRLVSPPAALRVLKPLLEEGLIQAGFPTSDSRSFEPWRMPVEMILERILLEWKILGREPTVGEVVWFTTTNKGNSLEENL
jgi:hypothetical protein